ncbi:helix-turn-helix domain-containing protein [Aureimonas sp. AU20]|uniref:helix-turn-helix domain-containing protein n=1 Tax=Aureimonas sp. AU20 TaxID=1349819 RepID=UPI000782C9A5|nr:helix-turn-helix domain-containing protein [Aureimonas sp. AU20]
MGELTISAETGSHGQALKAPATRKRRESSLVLLLPREGEMRGEVEGRPVVVGAGDLIGFDAARPFWSSTANCRWITIEAPVRRLVDFAPVMSDLHGHVFRSPGAKILARHMPALVEGLPEATPDEAAFVMQATLLLVRAALCERSTHRGPEKKGTACMILSRVERYILDNLSSNRLAPDSIARSLEISRATLYRAFREHGGIVAFITERRLDAAETILLHPEEHRSIGEIAENLGFDSAARFSKVFHRRFGCAPRDARRFRSVRGSSSRGSPSQLGNLP